MSAFPDDVYNKLYHPTPETPTEMETVPPVPDTTIDPPMDEPVPPAEPEPEPV